MNHIEDISYKGYEISLYKSTFDFISTIKKDDETGEVLTEFCRQSESTALEIAVIFIDGLTFKDNKYE